MVQTEQQYICIYQCLMAVLEGKENIMSPPREIHDNQGYEGKPNVQQQQKLTKTKKFPVILCATSKCEKKKHLSVQIAANLIHHA